MAKYNSVLGPKELSALDGADGVCPICGRAPQSGLVLDHDHESGEIRAWICQSCNASLGFYESKIFTGGKPRPAFDEYLAAHGDGCGGWKFVQVSDGTIPTDAQWRAICRRLYGDGKARKTARAGSARRGA